MTLPTLPIDTSLLKPGVRLAVGVSGGADSVALTRVLAARSGELGLVLHAAHLHHGLRGEEADQDQQFAADLAKSLDLPFHTQKVDTTAEAARHHESGKAAESIEEAARRLRYQWFRQLMTQHQMDAVATAHTLDDQAETVIAKLLRGAWTEGISGIHPVVSFPEGRILRPLLATTRPEIEQYLEAVNQPWREDSTNCDQTYTRNKIRHQLLPELEQWNPKIRQHLANMADLARDEEVYWRLETARLATQLLLTGRPVRGGGRASSESNTLAIDVTRLAAQPAALQRRLLRYAAATLGASLSYEATESLHELANRGRSGQQLSLPGPITAERTPRELRLSQAQPKPTRNEKAEQAELQIPGQSTAFGIHFGAQSAAPQAPAVIRNWRPGDRVTLRYSSGPRKIKEVLERMKISGTDRASWPVIEWQDQILWMQGAELQPHPTITITATKK